MDKKTLENKYRQFLKVAGQWNALIKEHAVFNDVNSSGEEFRYIGLTSDSNVLQKAREYIAQWQEFADLCKNTADAGTILNILEPVYLPVPLLIEGEPEPSQIVVQGATTTRLITREQLIKKYNTLLRKHSGTRVFSPIMQPLKNELAFFESEPEGETYRARKTGFTEVAIAIPRKENPNRLDRVRVGTHGALIAVKDADTTIPVHDLSIQKSSTTVYDGVKSIPCAILGDFIVYRLSDLDFMQKTYIARAAILRSIDARNSKFKLRAQQYINEAAAGVARTMARRKVAAAREALNQLEAMDKETIDIMMASGEDVSDIKMTSMRTRFGKQVEEKHGVSFTRLLALAKLR
ncbi:phage repressor protein (plasmid) [Raoultella ornithinolytica]|uniref:phage repressor protein n=1 Tax=Raoultella ornithinolytica TaxID=54291 RepID=UPI00292C17D3|nr:phage repressor protein [Raoultella ornithinolytica]MDV1095021.1 phage repressor protein [Raoultella ornithinolytica]MDV1124017.1 phage repressor protein [Raoultella ornithinolytica]MDV1894289.1 phage repressor protein [Raoultella ornithinolytica]